jgi:hypothetical protein
MPILDNFYLYIDITLLVILELSGLLDYWIWGRCVVRNVSMLLKFKAAYNSTRPRFYIIISTNNSVYSSLCLYYESAETVLKFDNAVYLNFFGKISKQLFVPFSPDSIPSGLWPPHSGSLYITHNDLPKPVWLLWTNDQLVADTSTWQHTTNTTDKQTFPRWDSNSQSQQASRPQTYALHRAATRTGLRKQNRLECR